MDLTNVYIDEKEEFILLAIGKLSENAYGVTIREELEYALEKPISIGLLYSKLDRLEARGLIRSWMGESTPERGGRAKRYFAINGTGKKALEFVAEARSKLLPQPLLAYQ